MITLINSIDASVQDLVHSYQTLPGVHFFALLTQLGDARVIIVLCISMAIILFRHKRIPYIVGGLVAVLGSLTASFILKLIVERPRPLLELIDVSGYSFPSMHATVSMAAYGFLAYMIWKLMHPPHHRLPGIIALAVLILLIGFSRLYLDVHYFSDVLAGFLIGGIFVWLGIIVTRRFKT